MRDVRTCERDRSDAHDLPETGVQQGRTPSRTAVTGPSGGLEFGHCMRSSVPTDVGTEHDVAAAQIFGPAQWMMYPRDLTEAISTVAHRRFGNQACLFTARGAAARPFRHEARHCIVGSDLGVAAPIAFFPSSGWGDGFFGDLHAKGRHGVEFDTETKVVVERWPASGCRAFRRSAGSGPPRSTSGIEG